MHNKSAVEIRDLLLKGEISALEIAQYFLKRISFFDKDLKSLIKVLEERVLKKAKDIDQRKKEGKVLGKLAGIPIVLKDNMHIKDEITTCGSKFLTNYKAFFDSTVARLIDEEDGLIIGKSNLDEFAMGASTEKSAFFPSSNPWDLKCVPGGSSGGSSAAVSARLALIGLGSDTGGSIRQPAALCGIVGFKPTYGRVSRYGLVAFGSSLDQIGPLTTNVKDTALMMEVIGKHCEKDSTSINLPQETYSENLSNTLRGIKIGVPWNFLENAKPEIFDNFKKSTELLKELGAEIIDIDLDVLKYSVAIYYILATAEASTNLARFDGIKYGKRASKVHSLEDIYNLSREEGFGFEVKKRIMLGTYVLSAGYQDAYYKKAQKMRTLIINAFEKAFSTCDIVIMPTSPSSAFEIGSIQNPLDMYMQDLFTISANLAGLPAMSLPSGFTKDNKPLGIQFIGPQLHDNLVIKYAYAYEQKNKIFEKIPPLFDREAN